MHYIKVLHIHLIIQIYTFNFLNSINLSNAVYQNLRNNFLYKLTLTSFLIKNKYINNFFNIVLYQYGTTIFNLLRCNNNA